jgi:hypothetical protein
MSLFRERLLARLVEAHALSAELVKKLLAWRYPGFSAHVGERIAPTDKLRLGGLPRPKTKPPSLKRRPLSTFSSFTSSAGVQGARELPWPGAVTRDAAPQAPPY